MPVIQFNNRSEGSWNWISGIYSEFLISLHYYTWPLAGGHITHTSYNDDHWHAIMWGYSSGVWLAERKMCFWPFTCQLWHVSHFYFFIFLYVFYEARIGYAFGCDYYPTNLNNLSHCICVHQRKISPAAGLEPGTPGPWVNRANNELSCADNYIDI